jgi:hypothetical protein
MPSAKVVVPAGSQETWVLYTKKPESAARLLITNNGPGEAQFTGQGIDVALAAKNSLAFTLTGVDLKCKSVKGTSLEVQLA